MSDFEPSWRYHATHPAKIIETAAKLAEAEAQGWADSPAAALEAVDIDRLVPEPDIEVSAGEVLEPAPDDGVVAEALEVTEDEEARKAAAPKRSKR